MADVVTQLLVVEMERYEKARQILLWQWFEVVDFIFERPELIDPVALDPYVESCIAAACKEHKKNNPLANGMRGKLGKFWKDSKGSWRKERRHRF